MEVTSRWEDNAILIALSGSFDKYGVANVRQAIFQAIAKQPALVVIHLRDVHSIDSSGLATLVSGLQKAKANDVELCLCALQSSVRMIFELTRLDKVFDIYVCEEDALLYRVK